MTQRTSQQNRALHKYFELLAEAFNESSLTVQLVLKEKIELDWQPSMVKELLWRPAQQALLEKQSTTELDKVEDITTVYEHLNRHIAQKFHIHVPFPSMEPDYKDTAPLHHEHQAKLKR